MSLYDKLGLLITPNGVAPSKIFAYKPTNGSGDGVFDRNTTATRVNSAGLIENVAIDMARIDYPTNGSCPHLLFEPQSTNLITYSEDFSNASWTKINSSITLNSVVSPDGTQNASKFVPSISGSHYINISASSLINDKSISIYVKLEVGSPIDKITLYPGSGGTFANFNMTTLTATIEANGVSANIEHFGNGWYRLESVYDNLITSDRFRLYASSGTIGASSTVENGTDSIYIYGAQLEALPYATSYIPTNGSAVTRVRDVANSFGDVSTFNSSEGTLFFEGATLTSTGIERYMSISDNSTSNIVIIRFSTQANSVKLLSYSGGVIQGNVTYIATDTTIINKIAVTYSGDNYSLWVNGLKRGESTGKIMPIGLNVFKFSSGNNNAVFHAKVKQVQVYKEALTDSELEYLTTYGSFTDLANANNYNLILDI